MPFPHRPSLTCRPALLCFLLFAFTPPLTAAPPPRVNVILWFDTEDYLLPADDDAAKRLCEMLTERGIRATFKIVGEKARVLEKRGRTDVIAALKKHDIGYHSDFHSVHPTPTEYLAEAGWLDGVAEFARREKSGAADVRRILGVPTLSCYGQPGSSWAPQAVAALSQIGVAPHDTPCYLDEGNQVGLNSQPFWYAGALHVFHMSPNYTRMELHDPAAVEPAKKKVSEIAERLRSTNGGVISIFYHPCEWVHQEFWDDVNFSRGTNPPREQWKPPGQLTAAQTEAAFQRFGLYIDHIRTITNTQWITASDLPLIYPDPLKSEGARAAHLTELAHRINGKSFDLDYQQIEDRAYSVADQFELFTTALNQICSGKQPTFPSKTTSLFGPDALPPKRSESINLNGRALRDALRDVQNFIQSEHRIPARVFIGAEPVAPADFLVAMATAWRSYSEEKKNPLDQSFVLGKNYQILPERHVAADTPKLFGDWVIHKKDFQAPKLMEQARLQAWTLKPAIAKY